MDYKVYVMMAKKQWEMDFPGQGVTHMHMRGMLTEEEIAILGTVAVS